MPVYKRRYESGKVSWCYKLQPTGATRGTPSIRGFGFETKREADEEQKLELAKMGAAVDGPIPQTLGILLQEFFLQHVDQKLAPKTIERYHEQAACLSADLLKMPIAAITPLHLSREWTRLLASGGHRRRTRERRPPSAKTVRNIAGVVSSAFARAIRWGLIANNPVSRSEPPVPRKRRGVALSTIQQNAVVAAASGPWCPAVFLEVCAGTGARRGEILALRWSDLEDGRVMITRSLTQTKTVLEFKGTKTEDSVRPVSLPQSTIIALETHREQQNEFRRQFGPDYRADLDLIFAHPDGTPLKPDSVSASVSVLCRRLKLPKGVSLHTLRHSHGSHLLAAGMEITAVSERLGHSSIRVTADVYSHAIRGRDDEAAKALGRFPEAEYARYSHRRSVGPATSGICSGSLLLFPLLTCFLPPRK
jgi:integrase